MLNIRTKRKTDNNNKEKSPIGKVEKVWQIERTIEPRLGGNRMNEENKSKERQHIGQRILFSLLKRANRNIQENNRIVKEGGGNK